MASAELIVKIAELESVKAVLAELAGERDRARATAVQLEQENAALNAALDRVRDTLAKAWSDGWMDHYGVIRAVEGALGGGFSGH